MVKDELCEKVIEVRRISDSDDSCCCLCSGCAEVDLWVGSTTSKKIGGKTVI